MCTLTPLIHFLVNRRRISQAVLPRQIEAVLEPVRISISWRVPLFALFLLTSCDKGPKSSDGRPQDELVKRPNQQEPSFAKSNFQRELRKRSHESVGDSGDDPEVRRSIDERKLREELEKRILVRYLESSKSGFNAAELEAEVERLFLEYGQEALVVLIGMVRDATGSAARGELEHPEREDLLSEAVAKVLVKAYQQGSISDLGQAIGSLQVFRNMDPDSLGRSVASDVYQYLRQTGNSDLIEDAFVEISNGSTRLHSGFGLLAEAAGQVMGYEKALGAIHLDNRIGEVATECAVRALISGWVGSDPVACSTYVRDLAEGPRKTIYLASMVSSLALCGRLDEAREWLPMIPSDSRYYADAVERIEMAIEPTSSGLQGDN